MSKKFELFELNVIRSDGLRHMLGKEDWGVESLTGVDFPEIEIFSEPRGYGNGDIVTGKRKKSRLITFMASFRASDDKYESERRNVLGFYNSNYTYQLEVTYLGNTLLAKECELVAANYPSANIYDSPDLSISLMSPYPDLFADNKETTSFSSVTPMWHWTRYYAPGGGKLAFGEITKTDKKVINYLGSEPAPIVITIKSTGYVPGIDIEMGLINTSVKTVLNAADVLVIDCDKRTVKKNGKDVPYSDFDARDLMQMVLGYGDNQIKISKDGNTAFTAEVSFVGRYGGV